MTSSPLDFTVQAFFAADHAVVENGKLYVNGAGWNRFGFPGFPQVVPSMSLVAILEVPFGHYNAQHTFRFGLEDPDQVALPLAVVGNFRVGASPDMEYGDPTMMPIAVPIYGLVIPRAGDYAFVFSVDDEPLGRYRVRATQIAIPLQFNLSPPPAPPQAEAG
jgi:hypothetical protein